MQLIANLLQANWAGWGPTTCSCSTGKLNAGPTEMGKDSVRTCSFRCVLKRTGLNLQLSLDWNRDHGRYTAAVSWMEHRHTGQIWHCVAHLRWKGQEAPWIAPKFILSGCDRWSYPPTPPRKSWKAGLSSKHSIHKSSKNTKVFKIFQNEPLALGSKLHDDKAGKCTGHLHLCKQRLGCFSKVNDRINSHKPQNTGKSFEPLFMQVTVGINRCTYTPCASIINYGCLERCWKECQANLYIYIYIW